MTSKSYFTCINSITEGHCGRVARALVTGAEGPGSWAQDFSKTLSVHQAVNGYLALFGVGEGEGGETEEWRPASVIINYNVLGTQY